MIPTLVTISNITQDRDGVWHVRQDFSTKPNFNFAMFDYDGKSGCRGILRWGKSYLKIKLAKCKNISRNHVCVWSILDLPTILQSGKMIINKVMTKHDPVIGECLRDSVKIREIREPTGEQVNRKRRSSWLWTTRQTPLRNRIEECWDREHCIKTQILWYDLEKMEWFILFVYVGILQWLKMVGFLIFSRLEVSLFWTIV